MQKILIANRGEIAIRIAQAASALNIGSVAIYAQDDAQALHVHMTDEAALLSEQGANAYLDIEQIVTLAKQTGCDAVHPGYGFLSENTDFAKAVTEAGLIFVGPNILALETFGDKAQARALADKLDVPLLRGTKAAASLKDVQTFFKHLKLGEAMMIKALAGGGGRGMQVVHSASELEVKYAQCQAEAKLAFGKDAVYAERYIPKARHIEVQILGDGSGEVSHVWTRECSLQRRHQKLVEIAPAPNLPVKVRDAMCAAAVKMAQAVDYLNIGTFEFLMDDAGEFFFMEANPRVQVEHTVTEAVTGLDLVQIQLLLAQGNTLKTLGLEQAKISAPHGTAVQARINMETLSADGTLKASGGTLSAYAPPSGSGVRVDGCGYVGYTPSPRYDTLLTKVIVYSQGFELATALQSAYRALCGFQIEGIATNLNLLKNILRHEDVHNGKAYTTFIDTHVAELVSTDYQHPKLYAGSVVAPVQDNKMSTLQAPLGSIPILAPMLGTIVGLESSCGDMLHTGQNVLVMEAMKMQHNIHPPQAGKITQLCVEAGDTVSEGDVLGFLEPMEVAQSTSAYVEIDLDTPRADLAEVRARQALTQDAARPEAIAKRRKTNHRTARENVADICDAGSFTEYGSLVVAAQRTRRSLDDLIHKTPADGIVTGFGRVNGDVFKDAPLCTILHYDYTVMAGTQGMKNHAKTDRLLEIATKTDRPVVFFTEGGGGRPGDTDAQVVGGLFIKTFSLFAKLSGQVPLIGINAGYCFAGNAAFLGCCDVIIATEQASIGMGGPAMIEGGGLGVVHPAQVGPVDMHSKNGVVDIRVKDEAEAVKTAKQYLSYFQGELPDWDCADQRLLRHAIPENRLQVYDVHTVIETMVDTGSVLELRAEFALGMVTALARINGKAVGIIANNPLYLAGAIDKDGADKAARFMQLCDGFDIPLLFLCDTPGIMVGTESESTGHVRHCTRLFVTGANLDIPFATIVLRKAYGLGAMAMAGGGFHENHGTAAWPTGEFGGMGLEGAVRLGFRKELAAIEDPKARQDLFNTMVDQMYETGKALNTASLFEIDDVIDPANTRDWVDTVLLSAPRPLSRTQKKRPNIDTW